MFLICGYFSNFFEKTMPKAIIFIEMILSHLLSMIIRNALYFSVFLGIIGFFTITDYLPIHYRDFVLHTIYDANGLWMSLNAVIMLYVISSVNEDGIVYNLFN